MAPAPPVKTTPDVDWAKLQSSIADLVREKKCGPILVRLSWHDAGTFDRNKKTGGPRACMRFAGSGESTYAANAGLHIAQELLSDIAHKFTNVSASDLWAFAALVAIQTMGGPKIPFRYGRADAKSCSESVEDGRLPDATKGAAHIREIFYRMGMNDEEIVALSGAHTVGRCHGDRSGFVGAWTADPMSFDNAFFKDLLQKKWVESVNAHGNKQFNDEEGLMMLPTDMALITDPAFKAVVEKFAASKETFFSSFAKAFQKLQESGYDPSALTPIAY